MLKPFEFINSYNFQQVSGVFFQQVKEELKVAAWPRLALPAAGLAFEDALDLVDLTERPASLP